MPTLHEYIGFAVVGVFAAFGALSTMGYQVALGYTRLEPAVYAGGLLLKAIPFLLCAVLAVFVQILVGSKLLGYLAMLVYLVLDDVYQEVQHAPVAELPRPPRPRSGAPSPPPAGGSPAGAVEACQQRIPYVDKALFRLENH